MLSSRMRRKKIRFSISESANHVCSDEMINHSIDILAIVIHRSARVTHKSLLFYEVHTTLLPYEVFPMGYVT